MLDGASPGARCRRGGRWRRMRGTSRSASSRRHAVATATPRRRSSSGPARVNRAFVEAGERSSSGPLPAITSDAHARPAIAPQHIAHGHQLTTSWCAGWPAAAQVVRAGGPLRQRQRHHLGVRRRAAHRHDAVHADRDEARRCPRRTPRPRMARRCRAGSWCARARSPSACAPRPTGSRAGARASARLPSRAGQLEASSPPLRAPDSLLAKALVFVDARCSKIDEAEVNG